MGENTAPRYDATATLKRTEWGMKYGVPNVGDEVRLDIAIEAIKD